MEGKNLQHLKYLSERATFNHILEYGSANVVIYAAEFHALEEAIQELEEKE